MSNRALVFWIAVGLMLVVSTICFFVKAQRQGQETEQVQAEVQNLRQQNGQLGFEIQALKRQGGQWG